METVYSFNWIRNLLAFISAAPVALYIKMLFFCC